MKTDKLLQEEGEGAGLSVTTTDNAGSPLGDQLKLPIKANSLLTRYKKFKKERKENELS